ncbi:MAG TPA: guanylate kinase [Prevotellaceae bacterium]|jgi:guanylate kinase|nr:guanylate kinase [Prevotellaceae bacterium]
MKTGKIIVFSAPSGSGKTTIVHYLMSQIDNLHFSVSATSRAPRGNEINGKDYYFLTPDEFRAKIQNNAFIEYEEVYAGKFYGTLKQQVEKQLLNGENVVLDVDVKGGVNIKKIYGDQALTVFIQPPSIEVLKNRLLKRGTDSLEIINDRIRKAEYEITFAPQFDKIIVNDVLEDAQAQALAAVNAFLD